MGIFSTSPVLAQDQGGDQQEGFGVQVLGGPTFSGLTDTQGFNIENKTGYLVGLGLGGNRGGTVGVEADILYGKQGYKSGGVEFDQNVVHVPVMLKINIGQRSANGVSAFGLGGGFFNWGFGGKLADLDISENTNGYEVGWVVGGGIEVLRLSVQARYMRGVRAIDKTFSVGSSVESNSQAFAILFGFRLN